MAACGRPRAPTRLSAWPAPSTHTPAQLCYELLHGGRPGQNGRSGSLLCTICLPLQKYNRASLSDLVEDGTRPPPCEGCGAQDSPQWGLSQSALHPSRESIQSSPTVRRHSPDPLICSQSTHLPPWFKAPIPPRSLGPRQPFGQLYLRLSQGLGTGGSTVS